MEDKIVIGGSISLNNVIDGDMDLHTPVSGQSQEVITQNIGTYDHNILSNRDMADQHPISAITRLENELNARPDERLTNSEIYNILNA